ncbi:MAG: bifunctional helix-turn-helix domain-containing protein/methylated-DNA--[protein]-cysteine S-methyltransferase [Pseudomonadota bacterium]
MTKLSPADFNGSESAYHYHVVRRALDLIDAAPAPGPSLETLAAGLGLSPGHLQRVFSAWVGVSPKRFQQYLTLDHAKRLLAQRHTMLETAAASGLSGGGRLHDLFLRWEAMSPGDYARAGEGLNIREGWFDSPFGPALIMATDRGICGIGFGAEMGREATEADLHSRWPKATYVHNSNSLQDLVDPLFTGSGESHLHLIGAPFQIKVWEALLAIPSGHVTTYSDLARVAGHPRAVRAVGTAVGRNPISWLIPCHRALRKSGALGGYHWGLPVKRALLAWESAALDAVQPLEDVEGAQREFAGM